MNAWNSVACMRYLQKRACSIFYVHLKSSVGEIFRDLYSMDSSLRVIDKLRSAGDHFVMLIFAFMLMNKKSWTQASTSPVVMTLLCVRTQSYQLCNEKAMVRVFLSFPFFFFFFLTLYSKRGRTYLLQSLSRKKPRKKEQKQ